MTTKCNFFKIKSIMAIWCSKKHFPLVLSLSCLKRLLSRVQRHNYSIAPFMGERKNTSETVFFFLRECRSFYSHDAPPRWYQQNFPFSRMFKCIKMAFNKLFFILQIKNMCATHSRMFCRFFCRLLCRIIFVLFSNLAPNKTGNTYTKQKTIAIGGVPELKRITSDISQRFREYDLKKFGRKPASISSCAIIISL